MRVMGLDIGTRNIGVALSDESGTLAQAKEVIRRTNDEKAIDSIRRIAEEAGVKEIVLGLPLCMNGSMGERAKDSARFAEKLKKRTGLAVRLWDERFSTREAEGAMLEASVRREKRKEIVDKLAAQIILQGYLDSLKT